MGAALVQEQICQSWCKINSDGQVVNKNRLGSAFKGALHEVL